MAVLTWKKEYSFVPQLAKDNLIIESKCFLFYIMIFTVLCPMLSPAGYKKSDLKDQNYSEVVQKILGIKQKGKWTQQIARINVRFFIRFHYQVGMELLFHIKLHPRMYVTGC